MNKAEQTRLLNDLLPLVHKMSSSDRELFAMMRSRHKDDEDFDSFTAEKLERLHRSYKPPKSKEELEARWKGLTSGGSKQP